MENGGGQVSGRRFVPHSEELADRLSGEYLVLLNNDVVATDAWLD
jgi:hypothetical protein